MLEECSAGNSRLRVHCSAQLYRESKAALSRQAAEVLDRLGSSADHRQARLEKLSQGPEK
jgi:hypothetical protein